jgi:hypothetical protein
MSASGGTTESGGKTGSGGAAGGTTSGSGGATGLGGNMSNGGAVADAGRRDGGGTRDSGTASPDLARRLDQHGRNIWRGRLDRDTRRDQEVLRQHRYLRFHSIGLQVHVGSVQPGERRKMGLGAGWRPKLLQLDLAGCDVQVHAGQRHPLQGALLLLGRAATGLGEQQQWAGRCPGLDESVLRSLPQGRHDRRVQRVAAQLASVQRRHGRHGTSGYDWLVNAFKWARAACPNAILLYNDYNTIEYASENATSSNWSMPSRALARPSTGLVAKATMWARFRRAR